MIGQAFQIKLRRAADAELFEQGDPPRQRRAGEKCAFFQNLAGSAAIAGHGVALLTPAYFAEEINSGRLVQLFPLRREPGTHYWLVYRETRRRSAKIRPFRDWLLETIGAPPD